MASKALVPKLRFPQFRDANEWAASTLGQLFSERQETGFPDLPLLSLMDKEGIVPQEESNRKNNSNADKSKYLRVVRGDVAYNTMRMWEGRSALVGLEGLISPAYTVATPRGGTNSLFFSYYFKTTSLIGQFRSFSQGLVKDTLNLKFDAFARIPVAAPQPAEQQKIAECLSSLDEVIAAEGRKLEMLRAHKKGLMHDLFPREGETTPRLRFPEFRSSGDWEEKPMGDLLARSPEYGLNAAAVPYSPDLPTYIRITDIDDDGRFLRNGKVSVDADVSGNDYLTEGDIVLARTGASVGKSYCYNSEDGRLVYAGFLIRIRPNDVRCESRFLANYLTTQRYWDWVRVTSARSGQPGINGSEYASFPVPTPPYDMDGGRSEQHRIASCLGCLDTLVTAQRKKIDALKTHKQGLMQGLFPSQEDGE